MFLFWQVESVLLVAGVKHILVGNIIEQGEAKVTSVTMGTRGKL